jgi:hypothetical protein
MIVQYARPNAVSEEVVLSHYISLQFNLDGLGAVVHRDIPHGRDQVQDGSRSQIMRIETVVVGASERRTPWTTVPAIRLTLSVGHQVLQDLPPAGVDTIGG